MLLDWSPCQSIAGFAYTLLSVCVVRSLNNSFNRTAHAALGKYKAGTNLIDLGIVVKSDLSPAEEVINYM